MFTAVPVCPVKVTADSVKIMLSALRSQQTVISNQKMYKEVKATENHSSILINTNNQCLHSEEDVKVHITSSSKLHTPNCNQC